MNDSMPAKNPDMLKSFIPEIAGLRAISLLWMIGFHIVFSFGFHVRADEYRERLLHPLLLLLAQGHLGVDLFFVISGYIIFRLLDEELRTQGNLAIALYYLRRWLRIFPAYAVVLVFSAWTLGADANLSSSWANFLMINNFLPFQQQALPWSWSIAIECQFYLLAPWLLLFCHRARGLLRWICRSESWIGLAWIPLFILFSATGIQLWILMEHQPVLHAMTPGLRPQAWLHMPYLFHSEVDWGCFHEYFNVLYDKPYCRFAPLLFGGWIVALERNQKVTSWAASAQLWARLAVTMAGILMGLSIALTAYMSLWVSGNRRLDLVSLSIYRVMFSLAAAYVLLYLIAGRAERRHSWLARLLSAPIWQGIAAGSYSAYLVHPLIVLALWSAVAARTAQHGSGVWLWLVPAAYGLTFACAAILYRTVERPLHELGRRWTRRPPPPRT